MTTCYISHPIKGKTEQEISLLEEFGVHYAKTLRFDKAMLPRSIPVWDHEGQPCPSGPSAGEDAAHSHACYMRSDLIAMLRDADAILMMPGWDASAGCRAELNTALAAGMPVFFYENCTRSPHEVTR